MYIRFINNPPPAFPRVVLFLVILCITLSASGQDRTGQPARDTLIAVKKHSPGRAALMSAVLPGLGQLYNKKYWKIPIVYAGFGTLTYFLITNTDNYLTYQSAYIEELNGATNGNYADLTARYTETELLSGSEYYRRNLEVTILLSALWYTLTIVDAAVDAHLITFDVGEDLSLQVSPALILPVHSFKPAGGVGLTLRFKN